MHDRGIHGRGHVEVARGRANSVKGKGHAGEGHLLVISTRNQVGFISSKEILHTVNSFFVPLKSKVGRS